MAGDEVVVVGGDPDVEPGTDQAGDPGHALPANRLRSASASFWERNRHGLLIAAIGTVGLRLITGWIGLVSQYGVTFPHQVARHPSFLSQVWAHWDAGYYLSIAQYGYAGRVVGHGQAAGGIAFAPLYPAGIRVVHALTPLGWLASAELLSAAALFVSLAALHRLATIHGGREVGSASVTMLLVFPTAFFLLAPYPESLCLAFVTLALVSAESERWLLAGVLTAAAAMTKYYMVVLAVALCVELWNRRSTGDGARPARGRFDELAPYLQVTAPSVAVFAAWMLYQRFHLGSALAFAHAQSSTWHRHLAAPWYLAYRTGYDLVHLRFLDTSVASVTELFDVVSVLLLGVAAVYLYLRTSRALGVLLGLAFCVFTFQSFLLGVTREVLVLSPLFLALGTWTAGRRWLERTLLVLFIPCGYFLIQRFVTGSFAG